jgi:hypothetical protein
MLCDGCHIGFQFEEKNTNTTKKSILCKLKTSTGIIKTRSGYITKNNEKSNAQKHGNIFVLENTNPTRKFE